MASSKEGEHGLEFEGRGKLCDNKRKIIYLVYNVFIQSMENAKIEAGCNRWNCSDLAAHLLSLEYRRR